jgi:hypothetical protein
MSQLTAGSFDLLGMHICAGSGRTLHQARISSSGEGTSTGRLIGGRRAVGWVSTELHLATASSEVCARQVLMGAVCEQEAEAGSDCGGIDPEMSVRVATWLGVDALMGQPFCRLSQARWPLVGTGGNRAGCGLAFGQVPLEEGDSQASMSKPMSYTLACANQYPYLAHSPRFFRTRLIASDGLTAL